MSLTREELDGIEARRTLEVDELRAFLELIASADGFLHAHGWVWQHTDETRSAARKLRRMACLPREGDHT